MLRSFGNTSRPALTSFSMRCNSFSDRLKLTHIGDSTDTVVSWLFCALTYVPSATCA